MLLKKLKISAFGPYKEEQLINFSNFGEEKLFLITGETGSGKTTIFDAISFALYGEVSGQRKEAKTLKSDFADSKKLCFVELEFFVHGKKYKIKRIPEQLVAKKTGEGLKQQKHVAELFLPNGKILTNLKEIADLLVKDVIGVDKKNFNKLIMLPQGKFQKLLTEKGEEQVNTFRKLFGTQIYDEISNKLFEEKQNIKKEYDFKVKDNLKKLESYILDEEIKDELKNSEKYFSFSEKLNFLIDENFKEKQKLQKLEEEIKVKEGILKEVEIKLGFLETFKQKKNEEERLKLRKKEIFLNAPDAKEFKKKKDFVEKLESLKVYYGVWQEKNNQFFLKKEQIKKLKESLKEQQTLKDAAFKEFEKVKLLEKRKDELSEKHNNFSVMLNNYNLAQKVYFKIKEIEKHILKTNEKKNMLQKKIEFKNYFLKTQQLKQLNLTCLKLIKLKEEFNLLKSSLEKLNVNYLNSCKNFYEQQAFILAKGLKENEPCPVCGSLVHPFPNNNASFEVVEQNKLEELRKNIFNKKDELNKVHLKIKTEKVKLEQDEFFIKHFTNLKDFKNLLNKELKNAEETLNLLRKKIGKETLNLEENYEEELLNCNIFLEKNETGFLELKKQKQEILKTIPANLQNKTAILNYGEKIFKEIKSLDEKITAIVKNKEEEEKKLDFLNLELQNLNLNFKEAKKEEENSKENLKLKLKQCNVSFEEVLKLFNDFEKLKKDVEKAEKNFKELEILNLKLNQLEKDLKILNEYDFEEFLVKKKDLTAQLEGLKLKEKELVKKNVVNSKCLEELQENEKVINSLEQNFNTAKILSDVAKGNKKRISFEKYVLTSCLNEVLSFANGWFKTATGNRYFFVNLNVEDCLNFNVFDAYSGKIRHVSTLSGGETFAASLALCLGLCSLVSNLAGGVELNTMLIDEGFGSLDKNYLDSVVLCLTNLNKAGRQIGVISHIAELKSRIKAQIVVKKSLTGGSKITLKN